jgi:adenylate kinase
MIIAVSGSVGSGKTSFATLLGEKLGIKVIHLNELAKDYFIQDHDHLQTFDFDIDTLLNDFEKELQQKRLEHTSLIVESHFAHFIQPKYVDVLFILNRDLKELHKEYEKRGYTKQKIQDNLDVESFNLCFYEAEENGYDIQGTGLTGKGEKKFGNVFTLKNSKDLDNLVEKAISKIEYVKERLENGS